MRQVLHMFAAAVFLLLGSAGKPIRQSGNRPSFRDFHERIWAGEIDLADDALKIVYGMVHLGTALTECAATALWRSPQNRLGAEHKPGRFALAFAECSMGLFSRDFHCRA
jgi:hypothetical protein